MAYRSVHLLASQGAMLLWVAQSLNDLCRKHQRHYDCRGSAVDIYGKVEKRARQRLRSHELGAVKYQYLIQG